MKESYKCGSGDRRMSLANRYFIRKTEAFSMKELLEIYTSTKEITKESAETFISESSKIIEWNFEEMARYCYQDKNGRNTLVELQVPTGSKVVNECNIGIELVVYEYEGEFENYSAETEVMTKDFDGDWETVILQMQELAKIA